MTWLLRGCWKILCAVWRAVFVVACVVVCIIVALLLFAAITYRRHADA